MQSANQCVPTGAGPVHQAPRIRPTRCGGASRRTEASDLWVHASLTQRQRLQRLFLPDGVAFDKKPFIRTGVTASAFRYLTAAHDSQASQSFGFYWLTDIRAMRAIQARSPRSLEAPGERNAYTRGRTSCRSSARGRRAALQRVGLPAGTPAASARLRAIPSARYGKRFPIFPKGGVQ
jgi:hypothetical protein